MTLEEKRIKIDDWCDVHGDCEGCQFDHPSCWCHIGNVDKLTDAECDEILAAIGLTEEDVVNHPSHYTQGGMECIDEMVLIFGIEATMNFCLLNTWKYRKRAPFKGKPEEDIAKSDWYLAKYKELEERLRGREEDF